jgi:CheY-like chemotaxis protein
MPLRGLAGARILIAEDEVLVSVLLESALADLGCAPVGPVGSVAEAVALAETENLTAAVLDVNLRGESVYPVADALRSRGIPFLFITGYRRGELPPPHADAPTLEKPFDDSMLADALRSLTRIKAS